MAITQIDYDEPNQSTYRSVVVQYGNKQTKIFSSGDFVKDWYQATKFKINQLINSEPFFISASSVDHFIMDGNQYESAWAIVDQQDNILLYYKDDISLNKKISNSIELFVNIGDRLTFKEFKEKYS